LWDVLADQSDGSVDALVAFDVIEHFTRDELIGLVDEAWRVLKDGGVWIIHVPNGESPFAGRMRYWDLTHELAFTHTSMSQLLRSSGFSAVACYEDEPVVHGLKSGLRWVLWKMIRVGLRLYLAAETGDTSQKAIFSQNLLAVAVK
jgi:SAM-dependent methyltransferase